MDLDGDFTAEMFRGLTPGRRPGTITVADAVAALGALLEAPVVRTDDGLLAAVEQSALTRPPVHRAAAALSADAADAALSLCDRWIERGYPGIGDLRLLNGACKLLGCVWLSGRGARGGPAEAELAAVADRLIGATTALSADLAARVLPARSVYRPLAPAAPATGAAAEGLRLVVLAPNGSRDVAAMVTLLAERGVAVEAVCGFAPAVRTGVPLSHYTDPWYPASAAAPRPGRPGPLLPPLKTFSAADSWEKAAAIVSAAEADVVLVTGIPEFSARVVTATRVGVVDTHDGALPELAGSDAVGWALLTGQPIACSARSMHPDALTSEVLAVEPVPLGDPATLRRRMEQARLQLLTEVATEVARTAALPAALPVEGNRTIYYRLHPHLRRILDASPYGTPSGGGPPA